MRLLLSIITIIMFITVVPLVLAILGKLFFDLLDDLRLEAAGIVSAPTFKEKAEHVFAFGFHLLIPLMLISSAIILVTKP